MKQSARATSSRSSGPLSPLERSGVRVLLPALAALALTGCTVAPTSAPPHDSASPGLLTEDPPATAPPAAKPDQATQERPAAPVRTPAESYAAGIGWLLSNQQEDGSWGTFESARAYEVFLDNISSHRAFRTATTALCVMALIEPSRADEKVNASLDKGITYLLTAEQPGRASGETFYNTWAHTFTLEALAMLMKDDRFAARHEDMRRIAQREINTLGDLQSAAGGWGYYDFGRSLASPTGDYDTSFNTASAIMALLKAREVGLEVKQSIIDAATTCLERLRLPSGAFIYGFGHQYMHTAQFNQVKGSLGRSQPCNLALWRLKREITHDQLLAGVKNLRELHHFIEIGRGRPMPHEAWYQTAGYYYFYGHFYAAQVIEELEEPHRADHAAWLANVMTATQDAEGSWFDFPLYGYHKSYGTALAVMTLERCLKAGAGAAE